MTLSFPPHWENRFNDILSVIPTSQKRIGVYKWHRLLGYLRSMAIALPGDRGLFSHMQEALRHMEGKRVELIRGVHQTLVDFQWLVEELSKLHT